MKKLLRVALVAGCMLLAGNFAKAQTKIGYVNFNQVVELSPELKGIQAQINVFQKQFQDVLASMQAEYQKNVKIYEDGKGTMTEAVRTQKEGELQDLGKRIQDYNTSASQKVQDQYNTLSKPLIDKVKGAISQVAKEKGYSYVLDSSQIELLVSPEGDNLFEAVKAKLGFTSAPATAGK